MSQRRILHCLAIGLSLTLLLFPITAPGQLPKAAASKPPSEPQIAKAPQDPLGRTTPRGAVLGFLSAAYNQKLSEDRANSVTDILLQQGHVPLTNMLAPGAMGESRQVAKDKAADSEAENRRVVVRILQNKGIAGL